jgi:hypothetical protein
VSPALVPELSDRSDVVVDPAPEDIFDTAGTLRPL